MEKAASPETGPRAPAQATTPDAKPAVAPGGGEVWALAIDAQEALLDYLESFYNLKRAGSALKRTGLSELTGALFTLVGEQRR